MTERLAGDREPFIDDDPTIDDLLGRSVVAKNLSALIEHAPTGSSFRLGIYGGWGEGKTSIMRMMASRLDESGIATAFVLPWMATDAENLTAEILDAIATAVGYGGSATVRKATATAASSLGDGWSNLSATDWRLTLLDKTIGGMIRKGTAKLEEWQNGKLLDSIKSYLSEKKLVVFIDDVDRTAPDLVPKLLLSLREALSLPNLFYVIGLSPSVVEEGLRAAHPGYSDALRFLEKIVEYPFFLPALSATDCARFAQSFARSGASLDHDVLASIDSLLPRNPRQLKLFVRTLTLLAAQWRRFDRDEISLSAAYLVQLLAVEFPRESRLIAEREADIEWIEKYQVHEISRRMNSRRGSPEPDATITPSTALEIEDGARRTRFVEVCSAIGHRLPLTSAYRVRDMLALTYQPPLLTWKEFSALLEQSKLEQPLDVVRRWVEGADGVGPADRMRAFFRRSVEYRSRIWSAIVDASTHSETKPMLDDLDAMMDLLVVQVRDLRGFEGGFLTADEWALLRKHFAETSGFVHPADLYAARREAETQLIAHALDGAPNTLKGQVFLRLAHDDHGFLTEPPGAYRKTIASIRRACEESVAEMVLQRFEQPDGVEMFWRHGTPEREVAFDHKSLFHSSHFRRKFYELLKGSSSESAIQKNALTFLRMLDYGAFSNNSSLPVSSCRALMSEHKFLEKLWRAATARRLNFRTVGSLRKERQNLLSVLHIPEKRLPLPRWWKSFEREFRQLEAAEAKRTTGAAPEESQASEGE